jgi:hexosaminidase
MKTMCGTILAVCTALYAWAHQAAMDFALVPAPKKIETRSGAFRCRTADIASVMKFEKDASIPREGYRLEVTPDSVRAWSSDDVGAFYAVRTIEQLARKTYIPDSQFADVKKRESDYEIPSVRIEDAPEFRWRGLMIDEARHFLGKEAVMRQIDLMADHKLNVFHWHLVDDQGWRLDLPRHPELVKYGAVRPCSVAYGAGAEWYGKEQTLRYRLNSEKYGPYFYSPEDVREIREYARARHVTIVPEIEIPGHERALLAARPDLSCRGEDALERVPRVYWSIEKDVLCAGNDESVCYLEGVFDEVCELFPDSPYIHIGGDECPKDRWKACPKCQSRMKEIGAKDERELQAWFTRHFAEYLRRKGRRVVGWDEVLHGDVPQNVIGMSWRMSAEGGAGGDFVSASEAVVKGHDMILTPSRYCYFSRRQGVSRDPFPYYEPEPFAEQKPKVDLTLEKAYGFDPYAGFSENLRHRILGVQASVWTESIFTRFDFEWKTWPRTCALAEIAWTGPGARTFDDFRKRMLLHRRRLVSNLVNCAPIE